MAKKNETVINRETAEQTVENWLDYKRVKPAKREAYKASIEMLIDSVESGDLILDQSTHNWELNLSFPVGEEKVIDKLIFKPRITIGQINQRLRGVKSSDADGRVTAYVAALTGQSTGVIELLDSSDYDVPQSISVFFM